MAKADMTGGKARPRGTKPVMQAFFDALDSVPEGVRAAVAKSAQEMIRDELKNRRDKMKAAAAKQKATARKPTPVKRKANASPAPAAAEPPSPAAPAKRRTRKPADASTTAV